VSELVHLARPLPILIAFTLALAGCGASGGDGDPGGGGASSKSDQPGGKGPCALLLQGEVDELFGSAVGPGLDEDLGEGVALCTWPAKAAPRLLLQVGPATEDIRGEVDLGEGYLVSELPGMTGPAAVALLEPSGDAPATVAVVALKAGDRTLVVSPIGLDVAEAGPPFERFKAIVAAASGRF